MNRNKLILDKVSARLLEEPDFKSYSVKLIKRKCTNAMHVVIEKLFENGISFVVFTKPVYEVEELLTIKN